MPYTHCRPTKKEIFDRLKEAQKTVSSGRINIANSKVVGELDKLGIEDNDQLLDIMRRLINEIVPDNYAGKYPPEPSYEKTITGKELWAFCWNSVLFKTTMYLKFALKDGIFYYVSLHESKYPPRRMRNLQ